MPEIGQTVSHYRIVEKIGQGGMGEVYLADDTTLDRKVALKFLPEAFTSDPERMARFQREAKLLASLNHPNIAAIYGLEESDGSHFLVMELIEGNTLADRLKRGPIPVEESLKLALQIAEALEAAHERGVIHRDLKPANIKVTSDGKVKVLDFGLAKAFTGEQADLNLSDSPTLSVAATQKGVILGTAAYMSPEQARGKPVDKRADIWAFGVVLYEMLTGRQLFAGEDVSSTLARVLEREPDFSTLPPNLHPRIVEMLDRCLAKESKNRCHDIADVRIDIQKVLADASGVFVQPIPTAEPETRLRLVAPWVAAAIVLTAIIAGLIVWNLKTLSPLPVIHFDYELPTDQQFGNLRPPILAVSPNGDQFVYGTNKGLYLHSLNELEARFMPGTDDIPQQPVFSPDGKWVGYWSASDNQLKKISVSGGTPVVLTNAPSVGFLGWNLDNTIIYGYASNVWQISGNGGNPELLLEEEGGLIGSPQILPDGESVMFTNSSNLPHKIMVQSLKSGKSEVLLEGSSARYIKAGYIVYGVGNNLYAAPFDIGTLEVTGGSVPLVEDVVNTSGFMPQYAISDSGTLVYIPGTAGSAATGRTLVWVDREGNEEPLSAAPNDYRDIRISPNGTRVALSVYGGDNPDIWIWDFVRENMIRLTFDPAEDGIPLWTPDGQRIAFWSGRGGRLGGVYWKAADGTGEVEKLGSMPDQAMGPSSWSGDGNTLVLQEFILAAMHFDIVMMSMDGNRTMNYPAASSGVSPVMPDLIRHPV